MLYFAQGCRADSGLGMSTTRKILIVDDDPELREALVEQLALHEEFESIAAESGAKGVQAAKAGQVDLVIMDVGLQLRSDHPHARDPHLPASTKSREGRWHSVDPGHGGGRLQARALTSAMSIDDDIGFFQRVPTLNLLSRQALRVLAIGAQSRYVHGGEILFNAGERAEGAFVIQEGRFLLTPGDAGDGRDVQVGPHTLLGDVALVTE